MIELLITAGIGLVVVLAVIGASLFQQRQLSRLRLKMELSDIEYDARTALRASASCTPNFSGLTVDTTRIASPDYEVTVPKLSNGTSDILVAGASIPNIGFEHTVSKISVTNWRTVRPDEYKFDLKVAISTPQGPLSPLSILNVDIKTDPASPPDAKVVQACRGSSSASGTSCRLVSSGAPVTELAYVYCDAGEQLMSGGGECLWFDGSQWIVDPWSPIHVDRPRTYNSWAADCYAHAGAPGTGHGRVVAWAMCCKL